jgi:DNA-directed RNA polymerase subunit RPC12/RpoP
MHNVQAFFGANLIKEAMHPRTRSMLFEMQSERVPCIRCGTVTKTDVHVDYRGGMAVYTLYRCPQCKHEFMEKDLHEPED